jgi:hypothetical protein
VAITSCATSFKSLLSRLYPKPKVFMVGTFAFWSLYFCSIGRCPRGGTILGKPSVRIITCCTWAPLAPAFNVSKPVCNPSQRFVCPPEKGCVRRVA